MYRKNENFISKAKRRLCDRADCKWTLSNLIVNTWVQVSLSEWLTESSISQQGTRKIFMQLVSKSNYMGIIIQQILNHVYDFNLLKNLQNSTFKIDYWG